MNILCLCATYGRPKLLANAIALFERQDYPADKRFLLVCDDLGQYGSQSGPGWEIFSTPERFDSMPAKYAGMLRYARVAWDDGRRWSGSAWVKDKGRRWDAVAIWDDDDVYLPNHLSSHAAQLESHGWSHPQRTYVLMPDLKIESIGGNHWASSAARLDCLGHAGGFPQTKIAAWDFEYLAALGRVEPPGRSAELSFVFRWASTGAPHLQSCITSPDDTAAYDRMRVHDGRRVQSLVPQLDAEATALLAGYYQGTLSTMAAAAS